jgi:tRNA(adenine34) deaminase
VFNLLQAEALNHRATVTGGVDAEACGALLRDFFRARRVKARPDVAADVLPSAG